MILYDTDAVPVGKAVINADSHRNGKNSIHHAGRRCKRNSVLVLPDIFNNVHEHFSSRTLKKPQDGYTLSSFLNKKQALQSVGNPLLLSPIASYCASALSCGFPIFISWENQEQRFPALDILDFRTLGIFHPVGGTMNPGRPLLSIRSEYKIVWE